ncbi:MAG: HAD family phosphatase [Alphaproteobacteria bacterium]|nr:HAD family phosphatase [Alphaproteobacteria bacterium]
MIKAIIWDFDGVIVDSVQNLYNILNDIYDGHKKDKENIKGSRHNGIEGLYNNFIETEPKTPEITIQEFKIMIETHPAFNLPKSALINSNIDFIKKSKEDGIKQAIASNSPKDRLKSLLKYLEIENLFDFTITPCDVSFPKPNPEMIIETTKWLGIEPNEALFIDDSETALQAGIEAGTKTALFTNKDKETVENKKINLIIDDINELDLKKF